MYLVELDRSQRLLVISAAQHVTADETHKTVEELRGLLKDIAPGFRLLADFRWLESMDAAAAQHIAAIMDLLREKKVASVARVMPDPHKDIGFNILSQFHYGPEIRVETFERLVDALGALMEA
jgi:anti-anti-sigma regulatory factor